MFSYPKYESLSNPVLINVNLNKFCLNHTCHLNKFCLEFLNILLLNQKSTTREWCFDETVNQLV